MDGTYKKNKGNAGQKGVRFQLDLVTVCLLNALNNHKNWKISSENPMAGKFDDIVIELDLEAAVLVQAKHKENRKITREQLLSDNSKNADFSLPKYFFCYEELKSKFQTRTVIICTNTAIHAKGLEYVLTRQQAQHYSLLRHEGDCFFYTFNENILPDLKKSAEAYLLNNPRDNGVDETAITEENLKGFLENLQLFSCYPCEDYLHEIIEQSLFRLSCSNLYRNISIQEILRKVENWFLQPKGEYLTEARAKAMLCEIRSDKYCDSLRDFKVSFDHNALDIAGSERIFHVKAAGGHLLQMLRIYYSLQSDKNGKLYVNPDDTVEVQKSVVEAFSLRRYKFLIIDWTAIEDDDAKREIVNKVRTILERDKYKKVILVANHELDQFGQEDICQIDSSVTFQDFSKDSRKSLLKSENILFQGDRITLRKLLHMRADYTKFLDATMLEELVRTKYIKVGVRPLDLDDDTAPCYVARRFRINSYSRRLGKYTLMEENLYNVNDKMIVISEKAGMGKSTVLTNMAVALKKTHPNLWVIKINLNDYTKIFRQFAKTNRTKIDAQELLNSQVDTKMTNQFEKLAFSIKGKVVLMLDGVDEISPDYTQLVLSLLNHCKNAPNFAKIFVTTRPHVDLKLKEVELCQMLPFTRLEQRDFLTKYWMHNLHLTREDNDKCKQYGDILINKIYSWTVSSQSPFTNVPLQVRMLAEIFQENIKWQDSTDWEGCKEYLERGETDPKLPEKFNIAKLYDRLIEKKRDIFVDKGSPGGSAVATPALLNQFEAKLAYHRSLAVSVMLPIYKQLFKTLREDNDAEEYILKIGIVQRSRDRVHFIHRTFAEYFLADSIVRELKLPNTDPNFQTLLIDRILHDDEFKIVRSFLEVLFQRVFLPPDNFKRYRSLQSNVQLNLIFQLAREGHVAILRLILENIQFKVIEGQSINVTNWRVGVPLGKRNSLNNLMLLTRQAGVNIRNKEGDTPLHLAVKGGHLEMVDFLVQNGADVNMKYSESLTPRYVATESNWKVVKYLTERGIDVYSANSTDVTVLDTAIKSNKIEIVEYLLDHGASINAKEGQCHTALHLAAYKGDLNVVKCLVGHGADVNAGDEEGLTPLHIAVKFDKMDIVEYLLDQGSDLHIVNRNYPTKIHIVANWGISSLLEYLEEHGADVDLEKEEGPTELDIAVKFNRTDVVEYFQECGGILKVKSRKKRVKFSGDIFKYLVEHREDVKFMVTRYCVKLFKTVALGVLWFVANKLRPKKMRSKKAIADS